MIRSATLEDLPRMAVAAREFYSASKVLRTFNIEHFTELWADLFARQIGAILVCEESNEIVGAIGGIVYPEPYSGEAVAQEFFWFIRNGYRGAGVKLYRYFEAWARTKDCAEIRMVHLVDSMPEKVATFYQRKGYHKVESLYAKRLI